jgi:hypothetical protein
MEPVEMTKVHDDLPEPPVDLGIDRETLAFIALKAKAFDALVPSDDPSDGSDAIDDGFVDALEDEADNPVARELRAAIVGLNVDAKASLVAIALLGRGDYDSWDEAVAAARDNSETPAARYLMGMPMLGEYIEEGAEKLGIDLIGEEEDGLSDPDLDTRAT